MTLNLLYMRKYGLLVLVMAALIIVTAAFKPKPKEWISLFDGKTLNGWKVGNNASTFSIENGAIKVAGPVAHLFYDGAVNNHQFTNFEFKADVMTTPGSNSGIYFHTQFQQAGFPEKGYEVQVNNSHSDDIRTGSLYDIVDVKEVYVTDNVWYTEYVKVEGKHVIVKINDTVVVDYTEPEHPLRIDNHPGRLISNGTFAFQGHDPKSVVFFKNILVKPL